MGTAPSRVAERPGQVTVTFEDGTTESFRLVVGADGVHSSVRGQRFRDWTRTERDTYVWSLWAPQDVNVGGGMVSVWGPGSEGFVVRLGDEMRVNYSENGAKGNRRGLRSPGSYRSGDERGPLVGLRIP
ncbi:MAG: FAD-dependent oxidoreductase [Salinibacter sp.]